MTSQSSIPHMVASYSDLVRKQFSVHWNDMNNTATEIAKTLHIDETMNNVQHMIAELPSHVKFGIAVGIFLVLLLRYCVRPRHLKSPDYYDGYSTKNRRIRFNAFPPPYPNGWTRVCSSLDVPKGTIKNISALGREFVAFRNNEGVVGVLDAYCPHVGAHLGIGGQVVNGNIQCPFHNWSFNVKGEAVDIPYCRTEIPKRARTKRYVSREILGMVFIWFHAEEEHQNTPLWELKEHEDCEADNMYFVTTRQLFFTQHVLEMHMNSCDYHHFNILHKGVPFPILQNFLYCQHEMEGLYLEQTGLPKERQHISYFYEQIIRMTFLDLFPVLPRWVLDKVKVRVTFEGPTIVHFRVTTPIGKMRMIKTILPVEPFNLFVESRWWAESTVPRPVAYAMAIFGATALQQDADVWQHKLYREKPLLVSGDGPFSAFKRYYMQFYSPNSRAMAKNELEW